MVCFFFSQKKNNRSIIDMRLVFVEHMRLPLLLEAHRGQTAVYLQSLVKCSNLVITMSSLSSGQLRYRW